MPAPARDPYFAALDRALKQAGIVTPVMVIDRDRLEINLDHATTALPPGMGLRIVAKSLPSAPLLAHVLARAGTDRLMSFNLPMLRQVGRDLPGRQQLLGKPLVEAAAQAYLALPAQAGDSRVIWLIDSLPRLDNYAALARGAGRALDIALEIDIGLHRGGFTPGDDLTAALSALSASPDLRFAGLMGYEPHLPKLPAAFGLRARATCAAHSRYRAAKQAIAAQLGPGALAGAVLNTGGSPTYRLYRDTDLANEVALGSVLLKPTDFDTPLLAGHIPAAFIATPIVKGPMPTRLPGLGRWPVPSARRETVFIHGGHWLATPEDPPGLRYNASYGRSSNQEMLNARRVVAAPGDFVFLRPSQSEAVLLQFGPLVVVSGGAVMDIWPTFEVSA